MPAGYGARGRFAQVLGALAVLAVLGVGGGAAPVLKLLVPTLPVPTLLVPKLLVPKLLVFGDSLVAGFGLPHQDGFEAQLQAALAAAGRPVQVLDGGVSGDTSAGGRARLDWALADAPDAVLVELGANDALRGTDPRETDANLTAILDALAARHMPVLFCGMLAPPNLGAAYGAQFKAVFERLGRRPGVLFDPFFLQGIAGDPRLIQADGLHPNAEGVRRNVARLLPLVLQLLQRVR